MQARVRRTSSVVFNLFYYFLLCLFAFGSVRVKASAALPQPSRNINDYVLFAYDELMFKGGGDIHCGNIGVNYPGRSPSGYSLAFATSAPAHMSSNSQAVANNVRADAGGVFWDLFANMVNPSFAATILGSGPTSFTTPIIPTSSLPVFPFTPGRALTANASDLMVGGAGGLPSPYTVAPGAYRDVRFNDNTTVTFGPGTFDMRNLSVGKNVTIVVSDNTVLQIDGSFNPNDYLKFGVGSSAGARIYVGAFGLNVTTTRATSLSHHAEVHAQYFAPTGWLDLGGDNKLYGHYWAQRITGDPNNDVFCQSPCNPGLTVTKQCGSTNSAQVISFGGYVINTGDVPLSNISVYDNQAGYVLTGATLSAGASLSYSGSYASFACGQVTDTVFAAGTYVCAGVTTSIFAQVSATCFVSCCQPGLRVTKQCQDASAPEQPVTFSGSVINTGNVPLFNIAIFDDHAGDVLGGATLSPGESLSYSGRYATVACGRVTDTVVAVANYICGGVTTAIFAQASATCFVPCCQPGLQVTKQCQAGGGQMVSFNGSVINTGNVPLFNIAIFDDHAGDVLGGAALSPGESLSYSGSYATVACGQVTDTVVAVANSICGNVTTSVANRASAVCLIPCCQLTLSCPTNFVSGPVCTNGLVAVIYPPPSVVDNCGTASVQCFPPSGTCFPVGTNCVTCLAFDSAQNRSVTNSCCFVVQSQPPCQLTLSCPTNFVSGPVCTNGLVTVTYPPPSVVDNCGTANVQCFPPSGTCFPVGTNCVTCLAFDSAQGRSVTNSCCFVVQSPCQLSCQTNLTVFTSLGETNCGRFVNYLLPSSNCGTVTCSPPSGSLFPVGVTPVACSAAGATGCVFTVTVVDRTPPQIFCQSNLLVFATNCVPVNYPVPSVSDNCGTVSVTFSPPSGSTFCPGTTNCVVGIATDAAGNTNRCDFCIIVQPTTAQGPCITVNPNSLSFADQQLGTTSSVMSVTVSNCGSATLAITNLSFIGANAADFLLVNNSCGSVPPGGTCTIGVAFSPTAHGQRLATLNIFNNSGINPAVVALSGHGFGMLTITRIGQSVLLRFSCPSDMLYDVETTTSLTTGKWTTTTSSNIQGTGLPTTFIDVGAVTNSPARFYRIRMHN